MVDSFTIEPTGEGCRLVYKMDYTPPYGFLGKLYYRNRAQESMQPVAGTLRSVSGAEGGIRTHHNQETSPANSPFSVDDSKTLLTIIIGNFSINLTNIIVKFLNNLMVIIREEICHCLDLKVLLKSMKQSC